MDMIWQCWTVRTGANTTRRGLFHAGRKNPPRAQTPSPERYSARLQIIFDSSDHKNFKLIGNISRSFRVLSIASRENLTSQEQTMKILSVAVLFLATIATAHAFTQTKTRAQVYWELIQAQQDGRDYVIDTSYSDVNPILADQLEQQQQARLPQDQTTKG
jgi:hypothetical protein